MKQIKYSIFVPQTNQIYETGQSWFTPYNQDTSMTNTFTGSDGDVDAAWTALTATDGTGGYVNGDLVGSAIKQTDGITTDPYSIDPKYNFASWMAECLQGTTADPVSGTILTL
jgi:hypothetical protein